MISTIELYSIGAMKSKLIFTSLEGEVMVVCIGVPGSESAKVLNIIREFVT
jgi:hypothetical protein